MKKLGLVLGSSGSRGSSYAGFIKALEENGIKADCVAGSSMGAVVGAAYCMGMPVDKIEREFGLLNFNHLIDISLTPISNSAILRSRKLEKKLDQYFNGMTFNDLKIPFCAVAVDLISGNVYDFKGKDSLTLGVTASASIPSVFRPVRKDNMLLIDGGIKCRMPITQVREMGAEVIVAVDALGATRVNDKDYNILSVLTRAIDIMDGELTRHRYQDLKPDLVLEPDLGDMSQYKFKNLDKAIEQGYKLGIENIEKIKKLIEC